MFRIKTDIRQYKCETKDKVEKLIRNWVIRPSDLIYNRDAKEWLPIGEHPSFVGLFGMLAEQEKNTPDTVVTARSPYADKKPADDPVGPGNVISEATDEGASQEVTHMISRPALDEESEAADGSGDGGAVEALADDEQRETDEVDAADRDEVEEESARETDVFDQENIAETMGGKPGPPEAPEGVEPPSSGEEVTMMTERTLEMLKITDEDEAADDDEDDDESEQGEPKVIVDSEEPEEETTNVIESPLRSEDEDDEEEEAEEREEDEEDEQVETDDADEAEPDDDEASDDKTKQPRLGRHDLPEELFATNEISSPEVQEKMKTIDDLGELSGASDAEDEEEDSNDGKTPRWGSKLEEDSGIDEAWAVIEDEFPSEAEAEDAAELRTTDELDRDSSEPEDDDWDEDEWEEEWEGDTPEPEVVQVRDFVSEGYKMPLPFPIRPTADDIRRGLKITKVAKSKRDRTYPLPKPKKTYEAQHQTFDLTPRPPRDLTFLLVIGAVAIFVLLSAFVASC